MHWEFIGSLLLHSNGENCVSYGNIYFYRLKSLKKKICMTIIKAKSQLTYFWQQEGAKRSSGRVSVGRMDHVAEGFLCFYLTIYNRLSECNSIPNLLYYIRRYHITTGMLYIYLV